MRSVGVEVERSDTVKDGWRSGEFGMNQVVVVVLILGFFFLIFLFVVVIIGGDVGGEENGSNHEVEEDKENSGSEPAVHGCPDGW